jgi:hypothetical protein
LNTSFVRVLVMELSHSYTCERETLKCSPKELYFSCSCARIRPDNEVCGEEEDGAGFGGGGGLKGEPVIIKKGKGQGHPTQATKYQRGSRCIVLLFL